MNFVYPFTSPQILTDAIFVDYGGKTGTSTAMQRQAAYLLAEKQMSFHIGTPVVPVIVTGTYYYPLEGPTLQLDWAYLQNVKSIQLIDTKRSSYYTIAGTVGNYYAAIRNHERSILDVFMIMGWCSSCINSQIPYLVDVVYECGLPTGVYTRLDMLLALTTAAQIHVNEVTGFGNESSGGVGVQEFRNQQYFEKRVPLGKNAFGSSGKAQYIKSLVADIIRLMRVGL